MELLLAHGRKTGSVSSSFFIWKGSWNYAKKRCGWCDETSELYVEYHDSEWGVPVADNHLLSDAGDWDGQRS